MEEQPFIMLIMNCKKYAQKALFQKKTWLPLIPTYIKYYHVIGDETINKEYIFDNEQRILWVKTGDDYCSLPAKIYASYKAIYETYQFKYLFKTDDDQILANIKFFDIITTLLKIKEPTPHYGGYVVNVATPYLSQYNKIHPELPSRLPIMKTKYCSGRFYFLSREAIIDLLGKKQNIIQEYLEDYAIGYNLDDKYKIGILHIATNKFFTDIELSDFNDWVKKGLI
jgi:hypothetical protein